MAKKTSTKKSGGRKPTVVKAGVKHGSNYGCGGKLKK